MASVMGINKIGLPKLSENMDPEDARALRSYLYQMQEQSAKQQRKQQRLHSMHLVRLHIMHTLVYSRHSLGSSVMNGIRKRMV